MARAAKDRVKGLQQHQARRVAEVAVAEVAVAEVAVDCSVVLFWEGPPERYSGPAGGDGTLLARLRCNRSARRHFLYQNLLRMREVRAGETGSRM